MKRSPFGATTMLFGSVSASGGSPATPGLPIVSSTLPSGLNLVTVWPRAPTSPVLLALALVGAAPVDHPHVAVAIDVDLVREDEHAGAEAPHELARGVELEHGVQLRAGAAVVLERDWRRAGYRGSRRSGPPPRRKRRPGRYPRRSARPISARRADCPTARRCGTDWAGRWSARPVATRSEHRPRTIGTRTAATSKVRNFLFTIVSGAQ